MDSRDTPPLYSGKGSEKSLCDGENNSWIIKKNRLADPQAPFWIGSQNRSVVQPDLDQMTRGFRTPSRFAEFHLTWQDHDYPQQFHRIGSFQVDRIKPPLFDDEEESDEWERYYENISFRCHEGKIQASLNKTSWKTIGMPDRSESGGEHRPAPLLPLLPYLGKTLSEILIRFLHEDARRKKQRKRLRTIHGIGPNPPLPCTGRRDLILRHARDNLNDEQTPYSKLKGRLGMYDLPR